MEACLPLNLRGFLLAELGSKVRIDDRAIAPSDPEGNDTFVRDLARAIRRFSFKRAHESWFEAGAGLESVQRVMEGAAAGKAQMALCLSCARVAIGQAAIAEHSSAECLTVQFHELMADRRPTPALTIEALRHLLYELLTNFRAQREMGGLPHFDLDYYVRGTQVIFTWRGKS